MPPSSAPPLPTDTIPLARAGVRALGTGCTGTGGFPAIATIGPPIIGNGAFALALSSLRPNAPAFIGVSPTGSNQVIGTCFLRASFPFLLVIAGTSSASGDVEIDLPIPWNPALSGKKIWVQGGAIDPLGGALGIAALTGGLEITIGG